MQHTSFTKSVLWKAAGVDSQILQRFPLEWARFNAIGTLVILTSFTTIFYSGYAFSFIFSNILIAIPFGILFGVLNFVLDQYMILTLLDGSRRKNLAVLIPRLLLSISIGLVISFPLQLTMFHGSIEDIIIHKPGYVPHIHGLIEQMDAYGLLSDQNPSIFWFSKLMMLLLILLDMMPILGIAFMPVTNYQLAKRANADIQMASEFAIIENAKQDLKRRYEKREELRTMPFGGIEFYIDYKRLPMDEMNDLFNTISNLYITVFRINNEIFNEPLSKTTHRLNAFPEDVLNFHSIETGNSITFKISTGWKPKIDVKKSEVIISMPQGAFALVIVGYLMLKMLESGLSNTKQILEIQKLKKELSELDNSKLYEQIKKFDDKYENSPVEIKEEFQREIKRFYLLTTGNANFTQTTITQDPKVLIKIENSTVIIPQK